MDLIPVDERKKFILDNFSYDDCEVIEIISLRCLALIHLSSSLLWFNNLDLLEYFKRDSSLCYERTSLQFVKSLQVLYLYVRIFQ